MTANQSLCGKYRKQLAFFICCCMVQVISLGQLAPAERSDYQPAPENIVARKAFRDLGFGLFVHWGIYSILGDGEWVMHNRKIPYDNYKRLATFFNPQSFNAKEWVALAKTAGMKYITITARHHDGFSMFKTQASSYNIVDETPYGKDPLMELATEAQRQGIALHFYYSLVDWGRPDYGFLQPIQDGVPANTDWDGYISFMKTQLTELVKNYPGVKAIWFDGNWERPDVNWHYDELYKLIHSLNPAILVGNNHHHSSMPGEDFQMFEKDLPGENKMGYRKDDAIADLPLETCETMNDSWGFHINDRNYKPVARIIRMLVNAAGRNANLLLNIGPMPDGNIQPEFSDTLTRVGAWLHKYGETIYGTHSVVPPQAWGVVTDKGNMMYAHILNGLQQEYIFIPAVNQKVTGAFLFNGKQKLRFNQQAEGVFVYVDGIDGNEVDTIIQLEIK